VSKHRVSVSAVVYVDEQDGEVAVEFEGAVWSGEDLEVHTATPAEYLDVYRACASCDSGGVFADLVDQELWDAYRNQTEDSESDWHETFSNREQDRDMDHDRD